MKNIYILGTPRSGKSTLATMIKEEIKEYSLISMEAVRNGFIKSLPDLKMDYRNSLSRQTIFPEFLFEFVSWNSKINKKNYASIVEGSLIKSDIIAKYIKEEDIVIFLGNGSISNDEIIQNIIKNDTTNDYSNNWSKEKLQKHFGDLANQEKENQKVCEENNFIYLNTSFNREKIFEDFINDLKRT